MELHIRSLGSLSASSRALLQGGETSFDLPQLVYQTLVDTMVHIVAPLTEPDKTTENALILAPTSELASAFCRSFSDSIPSPVVGMEFVEFACLSDSERLRHERLRDLYDEHALLSAIITTDVDSELLDESCITSVIVARSLSADESEELAYRLLGLCQSGRSIHLTDLVDNTELLRILRYVLANPDAEPASTPVHTPSVDALPQSDANETEEACQSGDGWVVRLHWSGPYLLEELSAFTLDPDDIACFQVYGPHPIYGDDVLLQIGCNGESTLGQTIAEQGWEEHAFHEQITFFVGRELAEVGANRVHRLACATALCIQAHQPAYRFFLEGPFCEGMLHVLNMGKRRSLFPEVSSRRWGVVGR